MVIEAIDRYVRGMLCVCGGRVAEGLSIIGGLRCEAWQNELRRCALAIVVD